MKGSTHPPVDIRHKLPPLNALTSVRFGAALYVALFHTNVSACFAGVSWMQRFILSGYTGVTFFFVLSGFILAYNYPTIPSKKTFWIARFARVYPVYFLSILLALRMHGLDGQQHPVLALGMVLGLVQAFYRPLFSAINPVAWTLSVEAFFYLVMPFLLPWMRRMRWCHFCILQALYLAVVVSPQVLTAMHHAGLGVSVALYLESSIPIFRLNTFLVGMFLGLRWHAMHRQEQGRLPGKGQRSLCLWLGVGGSFLLLQLAPSQIYLPLRTLALTYTFMLIIVGLAQSKNKISNSHAAQMAGEISYGFYILQFPVIILCGALVYKLRPSLDTSYRLWVFLPVVLLFAYASFRWFEIPARLRIRRWLTGRSVATRVI